MRYELLLQTKGPDIPFDPEPLNLLLLSRGAVARPDGVFILKVQGGELELRPLREAGRLLGAEIHVPMSDRDNLLREALREGDELARGAELILFDPQLLRAVTERDLDSVSDQFMRNSRYAGQIQGAPEAFNLAFAPVDNSKSSRTWKVALGLGAFLVVLYLVVDALIGSLH